MIHDGVSTYSIRPFRDDDRAAIVAIDNGDLPPFRRYTVEDWRNEDRRRLPEEVSLRLVAGEPGVGYLEVVDRGTSSTRRAAGVCELELQVAHEWRGEGIGSALFERALHFAGERGAQRLEAWFYQYGPDDAAPGFLQRRGFRERERRQTWHLDLGTAEPARFAGLVAAAEREGVRFFSYTELPDDLEEQRRLYDLIAPFYPGGPSFEQWLRSDYEHIDRSSDLLLVAEVGGVWVGMTRTRFYNHEAGVVRVAFTGTLPAYRGRGIASALKVRGLELLKLQGCRTLLTSNRVNNHPILAINRRLGFEPGPIELTYVCDLSSDA